MQRLFSGAAGSYCCKVLCSESVSSNGLDEMTRYLLTAEIRQLTVAGAESVASMVTLTTASWQARAVDTAVLAIVIEITCSTGRGSGEPFGSS